MEIKPKIMSLRFNQSIANVVIGLFEKLKSRAFAFAFDVEYSIEGRIRFYSRQ